MRDLTDKIAVVTGAGSGIGRAVAIALAHQGCRLALLDVAQTSLERTVGQMQRDGLRAEGHLTDVSDDSAMQAVSRRIVDQYGSVNILVNNAGVVALGYFEEMSLEDFRWVTNINAWGVIYGCKHFLPALPDHDGHVVNIISAAGIYGEPGRSAYAFTKFGIRGFSDALRLELAKRGVGVTSVFPGIIQTQIASATRVTDGASPGSETPVKAHPPEAVARKVVSAIGRNKARVLVGKETYFLDLGCRLMPALFPRLVQRLTGA